MFFPRNFQVLSDIDFINKTCWTTMKNITLKFQAAITSKLTLALTPQVTSYLLLFLIIEN